MQAISGTAEQPSGDVVKRVPSKKASVRKRADALLALRARTQSRDDVPSYIQRNRTDDSRSVESNVTEPSYAWSRAGSKTTAASTVTGAYNWDDIFEQIKVNPSAARTDDGGVLPLHAACGAGAPLSVIKMLLDVYPEAARVKCDDGYLPIFYYLTLVTQSPSEEIVSALIEAYPESAAVADSDKRLPIHYACKATGVSEGIFTTLLRAYPKAAYICDADGMYPVDYASANKDTTTRKVALAALIDNDPEEIRGQLPKEDEAVTGPDEDANPLKNADLEMLVKYFVDEKSLLIHLKQCVTNGSVPSEVVMSALMDCYPESAAVADEENKQLPLHLACQATGIRKKFFKTILHAYPQGAYVCDAGGKYPIDYAIANKDTAARKMALSLLSANDQGKFHGRNDQLPPNKEGEDVTSSPLLIHLKQCVTNGSAPDEVVITKLMDCYPESAAVADEENKQLPIHLACQATGIGEKVFKMLLQAYPIGAYACDAGGKYPIDYAIANKDTSTRNMALALLSANDEGKFRGRNDHLQSVEQGEEVALDDMKSQFSQSTKSLGSQKSAQLLQALLSNSSTKSQIVAIARSRSAMSKTSKHSSTSAQNFDARSRSTGSQISNSSPKSVQDFVPAVRSLSTSATSLMSIMTSKSPSTASQISRKSSKSSAQDMKDPVAMSRDTTNPASVDLERILETADLLLKDTRAALDQTSGSASIHSDGEHVPDSSSFPTAGDVMVQVARSASSKSGDASKQPSIVPSESAAELEMPVVVARPGSPVSITSAKSKISWKSSRSGTSKKSSKSRGSKSESSAAELEMPVAVARPDSPISTTSAKSKISWKSSKSGTSKKSTKSGQSIGVPATEKPSSVSEQNPNETAISVEECSASGLTSKASQKSVKSSTTEAEAAALLQAAASDENLAEVIDFLQSEYDVVLNKEEDEGDGIATKPKSSWSKLKGFFKTKKSKKMKK